ncbi:SOS response-associated peptidase [Alteriqipengyuania lutimaris]|nr:SOS response-associated peptidase family protein [Alteriqipengyuania lutimaris]MBB3034071.1 putative SOS response-associated peptidase YedK [Alteriqipengyuania lutimaris]
MAAVLAQDAQPISLTSEVVDRIESMANHGSCGTEAEQRASGMCNLYRMNRSVDEVARAFDLAAPLGLNVASELYPKSNGLVIAEGGLRSMTWGFPLAQKSKVTGEPLKPRPVNNTRSDKLDSFMWRYSFAERRCLIPLTAWAEAEGSKGEMTRTWLSVPGEEVFTAAAIWRASDEWGDCYSMVMTDAAGDAAAVHDRMPVILAGDDRNTWTSGAEEDARALCLPYQGSLTVERTSERWGKR